MREPKALEQVTNRRVLHPKAARIGQGIAQFKERDVRILPNQFLKERHVRCQLARPFGPPLWLAKASNATPTRDRLTLLQYISETAPEAPMAKVLT